MATENLQNAAEARLAARKKYIEERLKPIPTDLNSLNEANLVSLVKEFHKQLIDAEETCYDLEMKVRKQDYEVNPFPSSSQNQRKLLFPGQWINN